MSDNTNSNNQSNEQSNSNSNNNSKKDSSFSWGSVALGAAAVAVIAGATYVGVRMFFGEEAAEAAAETAKEAAETAFR